MVVGARLGIGCHEGVFIVSGCAHSELAEEAGENGVDKLAREAAWGDRNLHRSFTLAAIQGEKADQRLPVAGGPIDDDTVADTHVGFRKAKVGNCAA